MRKYKPVQFTLEPELLDRINAFCADNSLDRSRFARIAFADYLDMKEALPTVKDALSEYLDKTSQLLRGEINSSEWETAAAAAQLTIDGLKQRKTLVE